MGLVEAETVTVTTVGAGTATAYTNVLNGKLIAVRYVKDDYTNGVDFTITTALTGQEIWREDNVDASETIYPRAPTHDKGGAASLYDTVSSEPVEDYIRLAEEKIKIVLASGGSEKSGAFTFIVER